MTAAGDDQPDVEESRRCGIDPDVHRWVCRRMTAAGLCEHCAGAAGGWLAELGSLLPRLPDALAPGSTGGQDKVSGSREAPLPVRLDALSLLGPAAGRDRRYDPLTGLDPGDDRTGMLQVGAEPVMSVLVTWTRHIATERHLTMPVPAPVYRMPGAPFGPESRAEHTRRWRWLHEHRWARHAEAHRAFLARHHDWARRQADDAGRYAADIHGMWRVCKTVLADWPADPTHCSGVACRSCDAMAVWRIPARDGRLCDLEHGGCGLWYSEEDWDRWIRLSEHYATKILRMSPRPYERRRLMDDLWYVVKVAEDRTGHVFACSCATCQEIVAERAAA